ncbi:hypothetical protein BDW02DRAFT_611419 [Decorospora gaudefroyi]|uniref:Uncharacterized protein n=1 Tax=Decorospora gaudefroyi TaxID=184978 RepID=A0A6A5KXC9_9PLEO|nr:hypothetical protein BDW02DRAFT_611419 [Decorospora gaudefroyi]
MIKCATSAHGTCPIMAIGVGTYSPFLRLVRRKKHIPLVLDCSSSKHGSTRPIVRSGAKVAVLLLIIVCVSSEIQKSE